MAPLLIFLNYKCNPGILLIISNLGFIYLFTATHSIKCLKLAERLSVFKNTTVQTILILHLQPFLPLSYGHFSPEEASEGTWKLTSVCLNGRNFSSTNLFQYNQIKAQFLLPAVFSNTAAGILQVPCQASTCQTMLSFFGSRQDMEFYLISHRYIDILTYSASQATEFHLKSMY